MAKNLIIRFESGETFQCTPNHRVLVRGEGWVETAGLKPGDPVSSYKREKQGSATINHVGAAQIVESVTNG